LKTNQRAQSLRTRMKRQAINIAYRRSKPRD